MMSIGQAARVPDSLSVAPYLFTVQAVGVSVHARKTPARERTQMFGFHVSFQFAMIVGASLVLGVLVALATFAWTGRP